MAVERQEKPVDEAQESSRPLGKGAEATKGAISLRLKGANGWKKRTIRIIVLLMDRVRNFRKPPGFDKLQRGLSFTRFVLIL